MPTYNIIRRNDDEIIGSIRARHESDAEYTYAEQENVCSTTIRAVEQAATFAVGDGATVHGYSDSKAYTVIAVSKSGKQITLQEDTATLADGWKPEFVTGGFAGHCANQQDQRYTYAPNPDGLIVKASLRTRKNGEQAWVRVGDSVKGGSKVTAGRRKFHDYNF